MNKLKVDYVADCPLHLSPESFVVPFVFRKH